jgi:hypothetical protein
VDDVLVNLDTQRIVSDGQEQSIVKQASRWFASGGEGRRRKGEEEGRERGRVCFDLEFPLRALRNKVPVQHL